MTADDPENPEPALNPEPSSVSDPDQSPATVQESAAEEEPPPQEAPARPRIAHRAPARYLVTPAGPNDDRFVLDTYQSVLVCIQQKDGARRLHFYTPEPPAGHRDIAADALSYLTGAFPAEVPEDGELLQPIAILPQFLRVLDREPPHRQEFILATSGPRLYRPDLNEYGQLYNLEPVLYCCSGWSSSVPYNNEIGDIYGWFAWQPPLPRHF